MYSSTIFALTQLLAEMRKYDLELPEHIAELYVAYSLMCAVAFFLLLYYGVGFPHAATRSGYFFLMVREHEGDNADCY
jgi:ATP-binding cassette subfamily G (WHITE) protein 2 (SNQ2)